MSFQQAAAPLLVERPAGAPQDLLSSAQQTSLRSSSSSSSTSSSASSSTDTSKKAGQQWLHESAGNTGTAAAFSTTTAAAAGATTPIDQRLRTNIQIIRNNLLAIQENLGNLNRRLVSRRIVEGLHDRLRETYEVVLATERLFKEWKTEQQQQQTLDPLERQRMRFLYEKLSSHFQEEIRNVQEISERVREAAERVAGESSSSSSSRSGSSSTSVGATGVAAPAAGSRGVGGGSACCDEAAAPRGGGAAADSSSLSKSEAGARLGTPGSGSSSSSTSCWSARRRERLEQQQQLSGRGSSSVRPSGGGAVLDLEDIAMVGNGDDDPEFFLNDDEQEMCRARSAMCWLQRVVAEERYRGLQRIQGQVKQANQIFRDLAQLVLQQDAGVEAIDAQMHTAHSHVKGAATELYKAHQMQRRSRLRRCVLLLLVVVVLSFVLYFYSPFASVQRVPATPADKETVLLQQKQQQDALAVEDSETAPAGGSAKPTLAGGSVGGLAGATAALASLPIQSSLGTRFVSSPADSLPHSLDGAEAAEGTHIAYTSSHPGNLEKFIQTRMPSPS